MEEKKTAIRQYGDVTVEVVYGNEDINDLLVEYVKGLASLSYRNGGRGNGKKSKNIPDGNVCEAVKGGCGS